MSFTKTVALPISPDEAFALVTQPERLRRWKAVTAQIDLRVGGEYRYSVTPGHHAGGTVREIEPGKRVVIGWGWEGDDALPYDASTVTISIEPSADGSLLTLTHEGLTPEQAIGHAEGWNHFLARLEKAAATGDAGPDEWSWAPENLSPIVAAEAGLAVLQPILRNLKESDRTLPTPCVEFTVHDLAEHLMGSLISLGSMAGVEIAAPEGSLEHKVSTLAADALEPWRTFDLSGNVIGREIPAAFAVNIFAIEFVLHAWDFAQATGQELHVSDEVVNYVTQLAEVVIPVARPNGSFADELAASPDASPLERLAALSGRRPLAA
ncbi:MAG TPA: TIGR03086 family metal-binding protein [Marmoricola sp.]|nr:TIGR03086 family metal-binding protein [Marmoricola sp.]